MTLSLLSIPAEIIEVIAGYCDTDRFRALKLTCRYLYRLLGSDRFYQNASIMTDYICYLVFKEGMNIHLYGQGGTGKTFTIRKIQAEAERYGRKLAVTATTGMAASNFPSGTTIHSFSGLRLGKEKMEDLLNAYVEKNRCPGRERWKSIDLLVIDEVSMLGASFLDKLDLVAQMARECDEPMGGIQVIMCGDFLQLPPVGAKYAFESDVWDKLKLHPIEMTVPVRQSGDLSYYRMLSRIRKGLHTAEDLQRLQTRVKAAQSLDIEKMDIKPTRIYARNKDVEKLNNEEFNKLETPIEMTHHAVDNIYEQQTQNGRYIYVQSNRISLQEARTKCATNLMRSCPDIIQYRVGAQFILTTNLDVKKGYVNGSRCVYIGDGKFKFVNDVEMSIAPHRFFFPIGQKLYLERVQMPLRLGYASTVHSSQGCSLDLAVMDLGKEVTINCQVYVALSRVRSLDGLYLLSLDAKKIRTSKKALKFYETLGLNQSLAALTI